MSTEDPLALRSDDENPVGTEDRAGRLPGEPMTGTDRTDWERIARQTLWQSLSRLGEDTQRTTEEVADSLYWGTDLDAEQVERLRQTAFDLQYATEEYLAHLCPDTEPWPENDDRTPSWHPTDEMAHDSRGLRNDAPDAADSGGDDTE